MMRNYEFTELEVRGNLTGEYLENYTEWISDNVKMLLSGTTEEGRDWRKHYITVATDWYVFTTTFTTGKQIEEVYVDDVLEWLVLDCINAQNYCGDLDEFMDEFGYKSASEALKVMEETKLNSKHMEKAFSQGQLDYLMEVVR